MPKKEPQTQSVLADLPPRKIHREACHSGHSRPAGKGRL